MSQRIVVAYDRIDPGGPGWAEFILGTMKLPVAINLNLREGDGSGNAFLWEEKPHLTYVRHHRFPLVLVDVKFATFEGFRAGCHPTGLLGIAEGAVLPFRNPAFPFAPVAVKFDAHKGAFLRLDTGRPVMTCPFLLLTKLGAYGHFPPPPQTLQHLERQGEYFEPNASV